MLQCYELISLFSLFNHVIFHHNYEIIFVVFFLVQRTKQKMSKQFHDKYNANCISLMIAIYFYDFMISC